ncbi:MAG TPA: AMP-binding protein [Usitatibacter sp.]|nr:AMP-binding protein [Usitatibacter sp.]
MAAATAAPWSPRFLEDIPAHWAQSCPDATVLSDGSRRFTWSAFEAARRECAGRLAALGVRPGDRVMVVGENSPELVVLLFAITGLRAWVVNVNARLSAREVDAIRAHCTPRRVLHLVDASNDAREHAAREPVEAFAPGPWGAIAVAACDPDTRPEPASGDAASDVAALLYTTGTTGEPKGVMLTHANLLFIARTSSRLRRVTPADHVLGLLPISHVYGLASVCLGTLCAGASLHLVARFAPAATARFLRDEAITVCQGVPAMYAKLLQHYAAEGRTGPDLPALRFIYAGGSPLPPPLKAQAEAFFGLTLHNGYGLTEASPTVTQTRVDEPRRDCSVGRVLPGVEVRIVDASGEDVSAGAPGELWVRGPNVMKGYYRDPAATAATMRAGGWLATGDIAREEADGALFIEGRVKELIIRSGFNVYPAEVEAVLNAHPEVTQSAVVGREREGEEEVIAFVELAHGARATPAELVAFAARSLAPYKRPHEVIVLAALPAAANGKVLKGRLREMARHFTGASSPATGSAPTSPLISPPSWTSILP